MSSSATGILALYVGPNPNHSYSAGKCGGTMCEGATLLTDANGNGKVTASLQQVLPAYLGFGISDSSGIAFLEGFIVQ